MTDVAANEPDLAALMRVLALEDNTERLRRGRAEVCPVLADVLKNTTEVAREIYGDGWLDLVALAVRPAPRDVGKSHMDGDWADAGYCAKRMQQRSYRTFNQRGQRAMHLAARLSLIMTGEDFRGQLWLDRRDEVMIFEEIWRAHRSECLALFEAGAPHVWSSDVDLPGPPVVPIADQIDHLLRSQASYLYVTSLVSRSYDTFASARQNVRWGFLCLLPILVGVIEAALGRQPSVRIMHERLCQFLARDDETEVAEGWAHISSALRYQVFQRDGFRCVMCGATAATGAKLEVDHILPRAKGGKHVLDNLQTLCDRCNRGKSANVSPDLRAR